MYVRHNVHCIYVILQYAVNFVPHPWHWKEFYIDATLKISLPMLLQDSPECSFYTWWQTLHAGLSSSSTGSKILPEQQAASSPILVYITEI